MLKKALQLILRQHHDMKTFSELCLFLMDCSKYKLQKFQILNAINSGLNAKIDTFGKTNVNRLEQA
jgi:hypothetical protein